MSLEELNDDLLILIFGYCGTVDLNNLHKTSPRFENIIEFYFYKEKCKDILIASFDKRSEYLNR